jgi:hypothetical protein
MRLSRLARFFLTALAISRLDAQEPAPPSLIIVEAKTQRPVGATIWRFPYETPTQKTGIGHSDATTGEARLQHTPNEGDRVVVEADRNDPHLKESFQWKPASLHITLKPPSSIATFQLLKSLGDAKSRQDFATVALITNELSTEGNRSTRIAYDTEHKIAAAQAFGMTPSQALVYDAKKQRVQFNEAFDAAVKEFKEQKGLPNDDSRLDSATLRALSGTSVGKVIEAEPSANAPR